MTPNSILFIIKIVKYLLLLYYCNPNKITMTTVIKPCISNSGLTKGWWHPCKLMVEMMETQYSSYIYIMIKIHNIIDPGII